jgi:hypothetical protein
VAWEVHGAQAPPHYYAYSRNGLKRRARWGIRAKGASGDELTAALAASRRNPGSPEHDPENVSDKIMLQNQ